MSTVLSERSGGPNQPPGVRDPLAQLARRIDDVNARINDLRDHMSARSGMLMWGTGIGFAAALAILGALLARGG